jgi:tyrosyl-tRNA synthetase
MCSLVSENDAKKAGAEVVKQTSNAPLSGLIYPILQVLDEQHLDVDAQMGGMDQRKLFVAATEWLPKLGYKVRAHLISPMIAGLNGSKMSSSDEQSKIDLLDAPELVSKKVKKAECFPKQPEGNGVLALIEHVLLPAAALKGKREVTVPRPDGEDLVYTDIEKMNADYAADILTPQLIKPVVAKGLNDLMASIISEYEASEEWKEITLKAYPPPVSNKKVKKPKDKGSRHPGAGNAPAQQQDATAERVVPVVEASASSKDGAADSK